MPKDRHNVFVSYHHQQDQRYKNQFVEMMTGKLVDKSVSLGDIIDQNLPTEAVLQQIREDHIAQVSVTVVLVGRCTWKRKYVDWEIGASLRHTRTNPRCGLIGILLPDHPDFGRDKYIVPVSYLQDSLIISVTSTCSLPCTIGQTTQVKSRGGFIRLLEAKEWQPDPHISRHPFANNRNGNCAAGWPDQIDIGNDRGDLN